MISGKIVLKSIGSFLNIKGNFPKYASKSLSTVLGSSLFELFLCGTHIKLWSDNNFFNFVTDVTVWQ